MGIRKSRFVEVNTTNGGYVERDKNGNIKVIYKVDRDGCLIAVPVQGH